MIEETFIKARWLWATKESSCHMKGCSSKKWKIFKSLKQKRVKNRYNRADKAVIYKDQLTSQKATYGFIDWSNMMSLCHILISSKNYVSFGKNTVFFPFSVEFTLQAIVLQLKVQYHNDQMTKLMHKFNQSKKTLRCGILFH